MSRYIEKINSRFKCKEKPVLVDVTSYNVLVPLKARLSFTYTGKTSVNKIRSLSQCGTPFPVENYQLGTGTTFQYQSNASRVWELDAMLQECGNSILAQCGTETTFPVEKQCKKSVGTRCNAERVWVLDIGLGLRSDIGLDLRSSKSSDAQSAADEEPKTGNSIPFDSLLKKILGIMCRPLEKRTPLNLDELFTLSNTTVFSSVSVYTGGGCCIVLAFLVWCRLSQNPWRLAVTSAFF